VKGPFGLKKSLCVSECGGDFSLTRKNWNLIVEIKVLMYLPRQ